MMLIADACPRRDLPVKQQVDEDKTTMLLVEATLQAVSQLEEEEEQKVLERGDQ